MNIDLKIFPSLDRSKVAHRVPVLFRPVIGSPDQFAVGVVVYDDHTVKVFRANSLGRLHCFYAEASTTVIMAVELALDELEASIAIDGSGELVFHRVVAGLSLATPNLAEGISYEAIAQSWLSAMSSLHSAPGQEISIVESLSRDLVAERGETRVPDRLGPLILDYVGSRRPQLALAFSNEIRDGGKKRQKGAHGVIIDFAGSKLVANFGMLSPVAYSTSVDRIKRRLWDLKIDRDTDHGALVKRDHEMIVQHPPENDPQLSQRQVDKIMDGLKDLEQQADKEEIRFRPMIAVEQIGEHLLEREAA